MAGLASSADAVKQKAIVAFGRQKDGDKRKANPFGWPFFLFP